MDHHAESAKLSSSIADLHEKIDTNNHHLFSGFQHTARTLHNKIDNTHSAMWYIGVFMLVCVLGVTGQVLYKMFKGRNKQSRYD